MFRQPNASVEKRAFHIGLSDPRRSVTCAAVRFQARFTCVVSHPLRVASTFHFRGSLNVVDAGDYEFCLAAGDGALLFLDGTDVIDNDGSHDTKEECSAFYVEAGEYQLDLLWYQGEEGELGLRFTWAKDGGAKAVVPSSVLFPPEDAYSLARP